MAGETVVVGVKLIVEGSEIEGAVEVPAGRSPRRVLLPVLRRLTDAVVGLAEQGAAARGEVVACCKGCDACCRQMVPISASEAVALEETLERLPAEVAGRVTGRFAAAVRALGERGLLEKLRGRKALGGEALGALDRAYFAAGIACPFLEEGACLTHAERPLACREFLVTSDARHCAEPGGGGVAQLQVGAKVSVALAEREGGWMPLVLAREFAMGYREGGNISPAAELEEILGRL
jgi:Fe-S-cluster containining protein